jgi:hypothetical protein
MPTADSGKTERITIRCTIAQRERWEHASDVERRNLADWIRIALDDTADRVAGGGSDVLAKPRIRRK